jgi:two-component system CitB family sensor kinase
MNITHQLTLKSRMILIIGLMALIQTGAIGLFAIHYLQQSLNEQIGQRALYVANTIASMPDVIVAIKEKNTPFLQPLSLKLAQNIEARFIVIGDKKGIRLAHPNPKKIGHSMHDDEGDTNAEALIYGNSYVSKALGSLGWSMRGKAPVYSEDSNEIVGIISVGYHLEKVDEIIQRHRLTLIIVIALSFVLSAMIAVWFANHFKKAIFGLEPEQIAHLFDEQKAILESVREGIIAINNKGCITTINHTAFSTLSLPDSEDFIGQPINNLLENSSILDVLKTGQPQFDQEVWINGHNIIVNRLPLKQGKKITGVVSSFRRKDELDLVSKKLTRIQQYSDTLRSQAHEYSNKLHTIAGLIQINATDKALELIGQESQAHQELIQLLIKAVPDPIIAGCLLGKYNRARELGLHLIIDKESQMSAVPDHLPREELVSIIGNLIDNALEATQRHLGAGGEITLSMTDIGNDLIFEIEDQGAGISEQEEENIFNKGVTSKTDDGHGIGLYIVKKLLQGLDGHISITRKKSVGSLFTVYVPKHRK